MALVFSQSTSLAPGNETIYFGFGSNLWLQQMALRCPTSTYLGIARLPGYRWIINDRGYANVVQVTKSGSPTQEAQDVIIDGAEISVSDQVWGIAYRLQQEDERRLDINEGVPRSYTKETLPTQFWAAGSQRKAPFQGWDGEEVDIDRDAQNVDMLVYIDRNRTTPDKPKHEYIYRMNMGIVDALKAGVPHEYVDKVLRKYIPKSRSHEVEEATQFALKQAENFKEE